MRVYATTKNDFDRHGVGNIQFEISKVESNRFDNEYKEYYLLSAWGDARLTNYRINNDISDEQSAHHCYFSKLTDALDARDSILKELTHYTFKGEGEILNKYLNRVQFVDREGFLTEIDVFDYDGIVSAKECTHYYKNEAINSVNDFVKTYLSINLRGSRFKYNEGEYKVEFKSIDDSYVFYITTPYSSKEYKMQNISIKDENFLEEMVLALEFIRDAIFNSLVNKKSKIIKKI